MLVISILLIASALIVGYFFRKRAAKRKHQQMLLERQKRMKSAEDWLKQTFGDRLLPGNVVEITASSPEEAFRKLREVIMQKMAEKGVPQAQLTQGQQAEDMDRKATVPIDYDKYH